MLTTKMFLFLKSFEGGGPDPWTSPPVTALPKTAIR